MIEEFFQMLFRCFRKATCDQLLFHVQCRLMKFLDGRDDTVLNNKWQRCCPCISFADRGDWSRTRRSVWISSTLDWRSCWQVTSNRPNAGSERISRRRLNRFNGREHSATESRYLWAVAVQLCSGGDEASSSDRSLRFLGTGSRGKGMNSSFVTSSDHVPYRQPVVCQTLHQRRCLR